MYSHGAGVRPITPAVSLIFLDCGNSWPSFFLSFFISLWKSNSQGEFCSSQQHRLQGGSVLLVKPCRSHTRRATTWVWCVWCYQMHWFHFGVRGRTDGGWYRRMWSRWRECLDCQKKKTPMKLVNVFCVSQKREKEAACTWWTKNPLSFYCRLKKHCASRFYSNCKCESTISA